MKHFSSVHASCSVVQFRCRGTTKSLTFMNHTALETPEQSTSEPIELFEFLLPGNNL